MKKVIIRIAASLAALCLVLGSIGLAEIRPAAPTPGEPALEAVALFENYIAPSAGLDIKAEAVDGNNCIAADAGFLLSLAEPLEEKYVRQWLQTSPEFEYALEKEGRTGYRLTPKEAFDRNTVVTLSFDPLQTDNGQPPRAGNSWAFQTRRGFVLERTFPMDEGTDVPVNSAVELTFTGEVKLEDLKKNVSFTPALGGSDWRKTGLNTYSFLATGGPMKEGTVYEVRVKGSLKGALGGEALGEDYVFKFRTAEKEKEFWSSVGHDNNAFMVTEKPAFSLWFYPRNESTSIPTKVFRFDSMEAYAKALGDTLNYDSWSGQPRPELDTTALQKVLDDKLPILGDESGGMVVLPQALPRGFYAAQFTTNGRALTCLFQVTNLSAYAMSGNGDSLFWINDLASSLPVQGAEIKKIGGGSMGKTDAQGILTFQNKDASGTYTAYSAQNGADQLLVMLYDGAREEGFNSLDYWKYVSCDKRLYSPTDNLKFFGVVSPKQSGTKAIDKVTAVIEENYWDRRSDSSEIRKEIPVKNGIFEGEMPLPELAPGYYCLSVYHGEERLGTTYFEVKIYRKPAYRLSLSVDKPIVWAGERATATACAEFFDGTPVAQLDLRLDDGPVKTDAFGKASTVVSEPIDEDSLVSYRGVSAQAELPEIGQVYEHTYIQSVNSDVEIDARAKRGNGAGILDLQAFAVDFTGLDYLEWYGDNKCLKDFAGSLSLDVSWTRITYKAIPGETEKRYDPYTKTFEEYTSYSYETIKKREGSKTLTVKGKERQSFELPLASKDEYRIDITGKDSKGRTFKRSAWIYGTDSNRYTYDYGKTAYVRDNNDRGPYAIGEEVSLSVYENRDEGAVKPEGGAVLFVRASDKFIDYTISPDNLYEFTFDGSILPNLSVYGIWFDGREYIEHYYPYFVSVDRGSRALQLEVTPDKPSYRPGETAKLGLKLTGPDGEPVQGTVNLNMVDEALLALREQYDDIAEIFWDTYYFDRAVAVSHVIVRQTGGGEKGDDGGGDGDRSDLRDTALFKTAETDAKGQASVEVELPDNITSWRLIWQAFRPGDVLAGTGRANIVATLPFFVDVRLGSAFLTGDKPILGIRSAGTALDGGDVKYTVEIPSLGFKQTVGAPPSAWHEMPLPALKAGEHSVSVTGEYKEYRDKLTLQFTVADGIADHLETKTMALTNGTKLDIPAKGTAHLTFADSQKAQVMRGLWGILGTSAIRAEQLIAKQAAQEVLAGLTPEGRGWFAGAGYAERIPQFQRENGSIAPFTYGDVSELETLVTTAWACAVGSEYFSRPAAAQYLYGQLGGENAPLALMGLAALKEPVMQHINNLLEEELPPEQMIYLALGQVFIGNGSAAKTLVQELIKAYCETAGQTAYFDGASREETVRLTANLAAAAMLLDLDEGGPLFQYVLENRGYEDLYLLQQLLVLRHKAQSVNPECVSFTYTLDGKETRVKLFLCHSVMLTTEQLRAIRFSDIGDGIEVTASYIAPGFPAGSNGALSVSQSYGSIDIAQTGTIYGKISYSIDENTPDGYYSIVHVLPAGLEFAYLDYWSWHYHVWVSEIKGQQITFTVKKYGQEAINESFQFYARPVMTGTFQSEGTYITNTSKPEFTNSVKGGTVTVK